MEPSSPAAVNRDWQDFNSALPQSEANFRHFLSPKPEEQITLEELRQRLHARLGQALYHLFPAGKIEGKTFFIGNVQGNKGRSLTIELSGNKAGLWHDFATGEGGDIFDLWGAVYRWDAKRNFPEIIASVQGWLETPQRTLPKRLTNSQSQNLGQPTAKWDYQDINGNIIARVYRYDTPGDKQFRPWDMETQRYKAPDPRPLYNQPGIACSDTIILVEGEKCADALINLGICATTAMNGANAPVDKTDWSPLKNKRVIIWPDQDAPGRAYADKVMKNLGTLGGSSLTLLVIPEDKPEKWDAADAVAEGLDIPSFLQTCARITVPLHDLKAIPISQAQYSTKWPDPLPIRSELLPVQPF